MKQFSIKRRLIASVLLVELVSAVCITGLAFVYERHAHFRTFDIMLRGRADSLLGAVQDAGDEADNVMLDGSQRSLPARDIYEVWDASDRVLAHSPNWDGLDSSKRTADKPQVLTVNGRKYRAIRLDGVRVVDPGDKGGGVARHVTILYGAPLQPLWDAVRGAVVFYALTSLGLVLVTGIVMFLLLRSGLAPLSDLAAEAAGVSVTSWNFNPSPQARRTVELAPLASALTTVLKGLERSFAQQNQFVGDAAHELKTAVAVVKSSLQLLTMRPRSASEYQAGLERCQLDCERMEETVARMLTLARIESESAAEAATQRHFVTGLGKVARETAAQFESIAEIRRVAIEMSIPDVVTADIDTEQLQLLCSNLVLNAIQHTNQGGTVRISAGFNGPNAELHIADNGTGIDPEMLPHVFDRFYRGDPSRSRKTGGTGLGLAISKAIVLRFQGAIEIESTLGEGTTVIVRLPVERGRREASIQPSDLVTQRGNQSVLPYGAEAANADFLRE
jgi:signal transduction histidine kinase